MVYTINGNNCYIVSLIDCCYSADNKKINIKFITVQNIEQFFSNCSIFLLFSLLRKIFNIFERINLLVKFMKNNKTLIFGIGNEILTDDAIGPKLVKRFQKEISDPLFDFETAFVGGFDILEYIKDYDSAILIDAIKTRNGVPGDVYLFSLSDFKETLNLSNLHDISFLTAIEMGKEIGYKIPKNIKIIAIEIVEDLVYSNDFTPELQKRYEEIYLEIKDYILQTG